MVKALSLICLRLITILLVYRPLLHSDSIKKQVFNDIFEIIPNLCIIVTLLYDIFVVIYQYRYQPSSHQCLSQIAS